MPKDEKAAVVVFTAESKQSILDEGGSGNWVLNPKNAGRLEYLVCCRRSDWKNRAEGIAHRAAFLVGRIAGLAKIDGSENERNQPRYRIQISEYAELALAEIWRKELRNPVVYGTLKDLGIELRGLKFKPMPPRPAAMAGEGRMTIAEAKKALAVTFGVKPEDVEITIRG
ncbi:hypothetical protein [Bradyrhizobium sp. AZCC 2289]|uniref:hypothetical protein n=1 Tax=Bradyrhizobium sp. AZCC 2289 TaxID=3117026 RepID=UPI002FF2C1D4